MFLTPTGIATINIGGATAQACCLIRGRGVLVSSGFLKNNAKSLIRGRGVLVNGSGNAHGNGSIMSYAP